MNKILITKRNKVAVPNSSSYHLNTVMVATVVKNIESLGYIFSSDVIKKLLRISEYQLEAWYKEIVPILKEIRGNVHHKPMYKNFPKEVMSRSDANLYLNAIEHYLTLELPLSEKEERLPLFGNKNLTLLDLSENPEDELLEIFENLVSANTSLSVEDKENVTKLLDAVKLVTPHYYKIPEIPHKENLAVVTAAAIKQKSVFVPVLFEQFKNVTDVLRLATALSDGDVSLAAKTKYISFTRSQRKALISLLDTLVNSNTAEDLHRHKAKWIRLGEKLHVNDYKGRFSESLNGLRNGLKVTTFNSRVNELVQSKNIKDSLNLLKSRPSELARRLDVLLRSSKGLKRYEVLEAFKEVSHEVSTPILLQVKAHFENRNVSEIRNFFPKGNVAKLYTKDEALDLFGTKAETKAICNSVSELCKQALINRFSKLPALGSVYIDPVLKDVIVPFSQRSASKSLFTVSRGSKFDFNKDQTLRFFIYWKNGISRTDIDLSAIILNEDFSLNSYLSYYNLKDLSGCHSGDIVDAPSGASEFIDISPEAVLANGARYIVMSVNSYTNQAYKDLPICFAGWMERVGNNTGEIYEPQTVQNKFDLTADTKIAIPLVFDVLESKAHWMDLSLTRNASWVNNISANSNSTSKLVRAMVNLKKENVYNLVQSHVQARGTQVFDKSLADVVFDLDFAKQYDKVAALVV